jgi:hypothetical protein
MSFSYCSTPTDVHAREVCVRRMVAYVWWVGVLSALAVVPAAADTIVIGGCSGCFGLTYTLTVDPALGGTYSASLNISGTYAGDKGASYISAVNFKVASDVASPRLTGAPGGVADWRTLESNINNAGCAGSGNGFVCSQDPATVSLAPLFNSTGYVTINDTWSWTFTPAGGETFPGLFGAHIGAKFNNAAGNLNGVIVSETYSETFYPVPEPATLVLVGGALVVVGGRLRRIRK